MRSVNVIEKRSARTFSTLVIMVCFVIAAQSTATFAHPNDPRVTIEETVEAPASAGEIALTFQMVDIKTRAVVEPANLTVTHEKLLHAFFYDPALKEFRHEHPEFSGGVWTVKTTLPRAGNYWFWTQGNLSIDGSDFEASTRQLITGGLPENPIPEELGNVRTGVDGNSIVVASASTIHAGKEAMLNLNFSRTDGTTPVLTPYLGALAHVVVVPVDGDSLVHVHPMSSSGNSLMIHTQFTEPGDYRMWVQFIDGGSLKVIPLSVRVIL